MNYRIVSMYRMKRSNHFQNSSISLYPYAQGYKNISLFYSKETCSNQVSKLHSDFRCVPFLLLYSRISLICVYPFAFPHTTNQTIVYVRPSYICMYKCFLSKHSKLKKIFSKQSRYRATLCAKYKKRKKKTFKHEIFRIQPWRIKVFLSFVGLDVLYYFILLSFHIAIICFKIYIYVFKKKEKKRFFMDIIYFNIKMI